MPSPTSTTVPTERISTPASNSSIADLMIVVISSERVAISYSRVLFTVSGARRKAISESFETAAHTAVDEQVADPHLDSAQESGVDLRLQLHPAAGHLLEPAAQSGQLVSVQLRGAGCVRLHDPLAAVVETAELAVDMG